MTSIDRKARLAVAHIARNMANMQPMREVVLLRVLMAVYRSGYTDGALDENERIREVIDRTVSEIGDNLVDRGGPIDVG